MKTGSSETFGKYRLHERLAFGGMAEVFLATVHGEAGFVKPVVIKRILPQMSSDEAFVEMLIDEARITAQLTHSNICQVLDLGSVDGTYYIAMEYLLGEDVRKIQNSCSRLGYKLPIPAALHVVAEVLAGLDFAHHKAGPDGESLGIVHRDISPPNILVTYEGEVKLIDFGIAKALSRLVQTRAGVIKGKFRYMSPEQASGQPIDHRTDIFAAGVVLYELLRGALHARDLPEGEVLGRMRRAEFEPLRGARPEVSSGLDAALMKALSLERDARYATAEDFRAALQRQLEQLDSAFTRGDLSALMHELFDEERRQGRGARILGAREPTAPTAWAEPPAPDGSEAPREPRLSTIDLQHHVELDAPADPEAGPEAEDAMAWALDAPTTLSDRCRRDVEAAAALEAITEPRSRRCADPPPMAAGVIIDDDEQTEQRQVPDAGAAALDGVALDGVALDGVALDGVALDGVALDGVALDEHLSERRTLAARADDSERRTLLSPRAALDQQPARQQPAWQQPAPHKRRRIAGAGRFTRGDVPSPHRRQLTTPLRREPGQVSAPPRPAGRPEPLETAAVGPRRWPGPAARVAIRVSLLLALGAALAVGVSYVDSLRVIFQPSTRADGDPTRTPGGARGDLDAGPARLVEQAPRGRIRVQSVPRGARITLCGRPTGQASPAVVSAPAGVTCELELELEGYETYQIPVVVQKGRTVNIVAMLRRGQL